MSSNKIFDDELCLFFDAAEVQWRRVLVMCEGTYVELDLTPRNYPKAQQHQWEPICVGRLRIHNKMRKPGDVTYRAVVHNSLIYDAVSVIMMRGGMLAEDSATLLTKHYTPDIDMQRLRVVAVGLFNEVKKDA